MAVIRGELHDQRRDVLGEAMIVGRVVGEQHLCHAGDLRRRLGDRAAAGAGDQDMHVAAGLVGDLARGGDRVQGRGLQRAGCRVRR